MLNEEPQVGYFYWCYTLHSNLGKEFSDKEYRPVLMVKRIGYYAAIYPCSTLFSSHEGVEPLGALFQEEPTYLIYGSGVFYIPLANLNLPGIVWPEWALWRRTHAALVEAHLSQLQKRYGALLRAPLIKPADERTSLRVVLGERIAPEVVAQLLRPPERPKPSASPLSRSPISKPPNDAEIFRKALESLPPDLRIIKEGDRANFDASRSKKRRGKR